MDYRGELGVILINHGQDLFTINHGERICQVVLMKTETINWEIVDKLNETSRNSEGFGTTGKK